MKILRVANIPDNRTGGMSRVMYSTGDFLAAMGHRVDYLFAPRIKESRSRFGNRFITPWRVAEQVADANRRQGPYDVVEVHEPLAMWCGLRQRWDQRWPAIVVFSHGLEDRSYRAVIEYRRSKGLKVSMKQQVAPLTLTWQVAVGLRSAAGVLCLNSEDRMHLLNMGLPTERVHLVRNGVGDAFLEAGAIPADPGRRGRMLFLGTWLERKGTLDLERAAAVVLAQHPTASLTIAGCLAPIREVLDRFPPHVRSQIEVIPRIANDKELIAVYRRHQIFLLPSIFEGLPLVMLEAAALKLAIVTTAVCGMKDFISDDENGLLVSPGEPNRLAEAMSRLLADPDQANRLGEAANRSVRGATWERTARDLLGGYEAALAGRLDRR